MRIPLLFRLLMLVEPLLVLCEDNVFALLNSLGLNATLKNLDYERNSTLPHETEALYNSTDSIGFRVKITDLERPLQPSSKRGTHKEARILYIEGRRLIDRNKSKADLLLALEKLDKATDMGYVKAPVIAASLLFFGRRNLEPDYEAALRFIMRCEHAKCYFFLGLYHSQELAGKKHSVLNLLAYYGLAARFENDAASIAMGYMHSTGRYLIKNCLKACRYYFGPAKAMAEEIEAKHLYVHPKQTRLSTDNKGKEGQNPQQVIDFYLFNADGGDAASLLFLGQVFYLGIGGIEQNFELARKYLGEAAKLGNYSALGLLGQMDLYGQGLPLGKPDSKRALERFRASSKGNSAIGHNGMGLMYLKGIEMKRDIFEAQRYFSKAAELDYPEANYYLGKIYFEMDPIKNEDQIFSAYLLALRGGFVLAGFELARLNMRREMTCGLAKFLLQATLDKYPSLGMLDEGVKLYEAGHVQAAISRFMYFAEQGYEAAQYNLAFALHQQARKKKFPIEARPLYERALKWWSAAAAQGDTMSLIRVGDYHYYGWGLEHADKEVAAGFYFKAMQDKKSSQASFNLGYMHQYGYGLPKDYTKAKMYYEQAVSFAKSEGKPEAWFPVKMALVSLFFHRLYDSYNWLWLNPKGLAIFERLARIRIPIITVIIFGIITFILAFVRFEITLLHRFRPFINRTNHRFKVHYQRVDQPSAGRRTESLPAMESLDEDDKGKERLMDEFSSSSMAEAETGEEEAGPSFMTDPRADGMRQRLED